MKQIKTTNFIIYTAIFIIYLICRINYITSSTGINEIDFKTLSISSLSFPFEIIKETTLNSAFMPFYNFFLHFIQVFSKNDLIIRYFNSAISLLNILIFIQIGKELLKGKKHLHFALFVGILLSVSHFFLYYTNLIAPYSLNLLVETVVFKYLIKYIKKPDEKNFKKLSASNCVCIIFDNFGFIFVFIEIFILYFLKRKQIQNRFNNLITHSFIAFLCIIPILITKYIIHVNTLIPNTENEIGFNFSSLYLAINDMISPYLSFEAPDFQTKSTLGMLYGYFLNPQLSNINSLKIILTLFFSSILPIISIIILTTNACKNPILKIITKISAVYFLIISASLIGFKTPIHPYLFFPIFISILIAFSYEITLIKDNFIKLTLIFCIFSIQFICPEINTFNLTIKKNYSTIGCINAFIKDYDNSKESFIIMPYLGKYGQFYFKKYLFMDFDNEMLKRKNNITKNLVSKKAKTINKNNIHFLLQAYLIEKYPNEFLTRYFIENYDKKAQNADEIIVIIDKNNARPISKNSIIKCASNTEYNPEIKKIDFKNSNLSQNQAKTLYESIKSKTLYNILDLLTQSYYLKEIIEYKKIDSEYYKINTKEKNIYKAINSMDSDYAFIIFKIL